jgi:pyridoxal 5-phosphate dependent beta-lyase
MCADGGWSESIDEATAMTTVAPIDEVDSVEVRSWLIAERGILTTAATVELAPLELTGPVLRISTHVDTTTDDLETFAAALVDATAHV